MKFKATQIHHQTIYDELKNMRVIWKVSDLAYNRRETWDKWLLDRSRCHLHTSLNLFWSRSMAPWTLAAAYECAAAQSMDKWAVIKKAFEECGGDTSSFLGHLPKFHIGCRLGRELLTLPWCPWSHGLRPK